MNEQLKSEHQQNLHIGKLAGFMFLIMTVVTLLFTVRLYYIYSSSQSSIPLLKVLLWSVEEWYLWGLIGIFIILLLNRIRFTEKPRSIQAITLAVMTPVIPAVHLFLYANIWYLTRDLFQADVGTSYTGTLDVFFDIMFSKYFHQLLTFVIIISIYYMYDYYRKLRMEKERLSELQNQLTEMQLETLKTQLQPHFLFNTLNTITALIHSDPDKADKMTTRLADLLRATLDNKGKDLIPLKEELEYIKRYLEIQKIRFEDRLTIRYDIDPSTLDIQIPYLLLQPLVENAIQHGITKNKDEGTISVKTVIMNQSLVLTVQDNGKGIATAEDLDSEQGIGISNIKQRLQRIYNNQAEMSFNQLTPAGLEVKLTIPV